MIFILTITILFNVANVQELVLGYWVCDIIKQEMNVDLVMLPTSVIYDSLSLKNDSLIMTSVNYLELLYLVSKNISKENLMPFSGFELNYKGIDNKFNFSCDVFNKKEKASLITIKSLNGLSELSKETKILNKNIAEIISTHLQTKKTMPLPQTGRYLPFDTPPSTISTAQQPINQISSTSQRSKININTATKEELISLPGIGPKIAQQIIDYRKQNGSFRSIREIMNVKGIGPKKYKTIKDLITVQ